MHLRSPQWRLALVAGVAVLTLSSADQITFNVGTVAGGCDGAEEAHLGLKLFADRLSTHTSPLYIVDGSGTRHHLHFNYTRYNDGCAEGEHVGLLHKLIHEDSAHFAFGSSNVFAAHDARVADGAARIMYLCCGGRGTHTQDLKYVFTLQASHDLFPIKAVTSMARTGGVQRLYIIASQDSAFDSSVCKSAVKHAENVLSQLNPLFSVVQLRQHTGQDASPGFYDGLVAEAMALRADAVFVCDTEAASTHIVRAFHAQRHYLKALWLTTVPEGIIDGPDAGAFEGVLSASQWHPHMQYADAFFGTAANFHALFQSAYGFEPSHRAAGAAAAAYSLAVAIQAAFAACQLESTSTHQLLFDASAIECPFGPSSLDGAPLEGASGYERVRAALGEQRLSTMYGEIEFNRKRQNIAKEVVTTQISRGRSEVVLPLEMASKKISMPLPVSSIGRAGSAAPGSSKEGSTASSLATVSGITLLVTIMAASLALLLRWRPPSSILDSLCEISPTDILIVNPPMLTLEGRWESGKGKWRNMLVAIEPLQPSEIRLAKASQETGAQEERLDCADTASDSEAGCQARGLGSSEVSLFLNQELSGKLSSSVPSTPPPSSVMTDKYDPLGDTIPLLKIGTASPCASQLGTPRVKHAMQGATVFLRRSFASKPARCLTTNEVLRLVSRSKQLQHPRVVPIIGVMWSCPGIPARTPVLVRELEELGGLSSVLENETMEFDAIKKVEAAVDVASALSYLHAQQPPLKPMVQPRLAGVYLNKHCRAKLRVPYTALYDHKEEEGEEEVSCWSRMTRLMGIRSMDCASDESAPQGGAERLEHAEELEDVRRYGMEVAWLLTAVPGSSTPGTTVDSKQDDEQDCFAGTMLPASLFLKIAPAYGEGLASLLSKCCSANPAERPLFDQIHHQISELCMDQIRAACHEQQMENRRRSITKRAALQARSDELLYDVFPKRVAEALKSGKVPDPEPYPCISLFFSDVCGYTDICSKLTPKEVMDMLNRLYSKFDALAQELQLFKVETIGDSYMCASNIKQPLPDTHAAHMAKFAFRCCKAANTELICPSKPDLGFIHIRVGIHAGPVMGAVVGTLNRRYCLFGDTVNVASRMESSSIQDHIQCSAAFMNLLKEQWKEAAKLAVPLGVRLIKGKGGMHTYYLFPPEHKDHAAFLRHAESDWASAPPTINTEMSPFDHSLCWAAGLG